jgi:hypothetical protein
VTSPLHAHETEEDNRLNLQGAVRLSGVRLYYTTTSAGLAHAGSIVGESNSSTIAYDICFDTDISAGTEPCSVRSVKPMPALLSPIMMCPSHLPATVPSTRTKTPVQLIPRYRKYHLHPRRCPSTPRLWEQQVSIFALESEWAETIQTSNRELVDSR